MTNANNETDWQNSWQYKRVLEILEDYWLSQPDEKEVIIDMQFEHKSGQYQRKRIIWENPNVKEWERRNVEDKRS